MKHRIFSVAFLFAVLLSIIGRVNAAPLKMACKYTELRTNLLNGTTEEFDTDSFSFIFDAEAKTVNGVKPGKGGFGLVSGKDATLTITDAEISSSMYTDDGKWTQTINRLDGSYKASKPIKQGSDLKVEFLGHCAPTKLMF